jgi:acetolactate synthase-1/2/3 large subunit
MQRANIEPLGVDIHTPQFSALAHAYGWSYRLVRSPQAFADALEQPPAEPLMIEIEQDAFLSSVDGA